MVKSRQTFQVMSAKRKYATIDSVVRMEKKNYLQVYLEECKYKVKKIQMSKFINTELESDSESDSESESKSDTELMAKLESSSDSDYG